MTRKRTNRPEKDRAPEVEAEVVVPGSAMAPARPPKAPTIVDDIFTGEESFEWNDELTQPLVENLCCAAKVGGFKRQTALACGVRPETLEWWLDEGMRPDGPPLMRQLSARFLSIQEGGNLQLVAVVQRAAQCGDWEAALALLKHRNPLWRGGEKFIERDNAPPETSLADRRVAMVAMLKNPTPEMAAVMKEAGVQVLPEPASTDEKP